MITVVIMDDDMPAAATVGELLGDDVCGRLRIDVQLDEDELRELVRRGKLFEPAVAAGDQLIRTLLVTLADVAGVDLEQLAVEHGSTPGDIDTVANFRIDDAVAERLRRPRIFS